jgi:hypothetical protein
MCGIAGFLAGTGTVPDRAVLAGMTRALAHRGPDAEGLSIDGPVALGHRRLSVIDLSTAANQPMSDATGRYLLVFNGEIYNFREVRGKLEALGQAFRTNGDSEVLLAALITWGPRASEHLLGMFAFALWDRQAQRLQCDAALQGAALRLCLRAVESCLRAGSPGAGLAARLGAVAFIHRSGSTLNPHLHFHCALRATLGLLVPAAATRDRRARRRARVTRAPRENTPTATPNHSIPPAARPRQPVIT